MPDSSPLSTACSRSSSGKALRSEIRLVCDGDAVVEEREITFLANLLAERRFRAPITPDRLPGRVEGVRVLHRHMDFEPLAAVDPPEPLHDLPLLPPRRPLISHQRLR